VRDERDRSRIKNLEPTTDDRRPTTDDQWWRVTASKQARRRHGYRRYGRE
jgi:hypothetical protein